MEALLTSCASPGIRPGLARVRRLLALLGDPLAGTPVVHVVGTNGKGSTCAFLDSIFRAAGYRTAMYTSPHLESPAERLTVDGAALPADRWLAAAELAVRTVEADGVLMEDRPSYFELVTAAAFLLARDEGSELAVVEAGLGGRLDATNTFSASDTLCTAVASVSMDHTEYLGNTLEAIAGEKFAVVRAGAPACYLGDNPSLVPLFEEFCGRAGAAPFVVSRDAEVSNARASEQGCTFDFCSRSMGGGAVPEASLTGVHTGLIGRHQIANASLAISAALAADRRLAAGSRLPRITDDAILSGIAGARWPGRLEVFRLAAENGRKSVVLDGGHNPDGVKKLAECVSELWGERGKKIGIVYAAMRDKEYRKCLSTLSQIFPAPAPALYPTQVPGMERCLPADRLALAAGALTGWRSAPEPFDAPMLAVRRSVAENEVTVVCGSLYLVGRVRKELAAP
jgi:dihydrofolate synthase/folylpolyglutamate synthase